MFHLQEGYIVDVRLHSAFTLVLFLNIVIFNIFHSFEAEIANPITSFK